MPALALARRDRLMGLYARPDSPYWYLYLPHTRERVKTAILVGETAAQKADSRQLALDLYHQRMNARAARLYKLPTAQPAIRFEPYAATYAADTIPHHKGARRELELLKPLRAFFGADLLTTIEPDRVRAYMTHRRARVAAVTVNREVDLLKAMMRDAVPKYLQASPIAGLKRLRIVPPKRRLLARADERALLRVCDRQERALLILGLDTLIRLGDLLELRRSDRDGPWLFVRDPKGGQSYEAALSPRAARALDALGKAGDYYFSKFRAAKNPRDWTSAVRQRFERLCREADILYGQKAGGFSWHWATRRTGATRLLIDKRVPVSVVQQQGGWKTPDVLLTIYSEAAKADLLKAVGQRFTKRSQSTRKRA